ncbi:MAG: radical SAM protein [Thermodesulfobacteriota bacterium]
MSFVPSYIKLYNSGELEKRSGLLNEVLKECRLCPRRCGVNRLQGKTGVCSAGKDLMISSAFPHFGEEPPLVGYYGSGTIFLTHCNLRCIFCQNFDISHLGEGRSTTTSEMAKQMLRLQRKGCHNINFVTPTHYAPQIVASLIKAVEDGLELPIVWNCGGYESIDVIRLLEGIVDIYMPDIKYSRSESAMRYSNAADYPDVVKEVVKEMHRQVGDLVLDSRGIAIKGLLVRHLVMPGGVEETKEIIRFVAEEISMETYINIMDQYRPMYKAGEYQEINRRITSDEYAEAIETAKRYGFHRGF